MWPDLAKFCHFGKTSKVFGYSFMVYFVLGKLLNIIGQIFMTLDKFSLLLMAQYWKDNLAIWSYCLWPQQTKRTLTKRNDKTFLISFRNLKSTFKHNYGQCDQIGRYIGLWVTFQSLWQQLACPNILHSSAIFVKVSKSLIFLVQSIFG